MPRPRHPLTPELARRAQELDLTPSAMAWRVKHWGLARALATPKYQQPPDKRSGMADAIARYYAEHPDAIPPWAR